jgi:hypothetical protein
VAYILLSPRDRASYQKDPSALQQVLNTFVYLKPEAVQQKNEGVSAKQDAPKVIETDDMKLAMKADENETAGKYDEALKLYAEAIDLKRSSCAVRVSQSRHVVFTGQSLRKIDNRELPICNVRSMTSRLPFVSAQLPKEELNRGLEKVTARANLEEATKLLASETHD